MVCSFYCSFSIALPTLQTCRAPAWSLTARLLCAFKLREKGNGSLQGQRNLWDHLDNIEWLGHVVFQSSDTGRQVELSITPWCFVMHFSQIHVAFSSLNLKSEMYQDFTKKASKDASKNAKETQLKIMFNCCCCGPISFLAPVFLRKWPSWLKSSLATSTTCAACGFGSRKKWRQSSNMMLSIAMKVCFLMGVLAQMFCQILLGIKMIGRQIILAKPWPRWLIAKLFWPTDETGDWLPNFFGHRLTCVMCFPKTASQIWKPANAFHGV